MVKQSRAAILPTNIILLQNLVKRDPQSYYEEFQQQYAHYESLRDIFMLDGINGAETGADNTLIPSAVDDLGGTSTNASTAQLVELIGFVSQVCSCFPKDTANFPNELKQLLLEHHKALSFSLKEKILTSLTMLRNKGVITSEQLLQTLFPLLVIYSTHGNSIEVNSHAKELRQLVYKNLVSILRTCNTGMKNQKINKSTQAICFNLLEQTDGRGIWAAKLTRELWRRGIWDDSRSVEIMTQAASHEEVKIVMSGVSFFLDADREREENFEDDSDDENGFDLNALKHKMQVNKKTSRRGRKLENAVKTIKKKNKANGNPQGYLNFSAIHLLRDPQGFAENIFKRHLSGKSANKFNMEQKIAIIQLLSRLIGTHKLMVLSLYTFLLKYLTPKQKDVTKILAASAQACHELVPPDILNSMVRKIADEFISEGVASEVAAAGLNTIREICSRAPLAIEETLLQDLSEYKSSKAKGVNMAAKSLIALYRTVAPEMLRRKDRGKVASIEVQGSKKSRDGKAKMPQFGVERHVEGIEGIELLEKWKRDNVDPDAEENDEDAMWEVIQNDESDGSDDGDGWVKMDSDGEHDIEMSSDNEEEQNTRADIVDEMEETESNSQEPSHRLESTTILTPADFAKLQELRNEEALNKAMGVRPVSANEELVDADRLVGPVKYKQTREERMQHILEGREGREKYSSRRGKRDNVRSTTNREKARKKNFVMTLHKRSIKGKQKMSLRDRQKVLKAHITKQKKKGH